MKIVQIESEIPSARNDQRIQSARVLNNDEELTRVKSVYDDATMASTDDEQLSASTDRLCPKAVRTVDAEPEVEPRQRSVYWHRTWPRRSTSFCKPTNDRQMRIYRLTLS